MAKPVLPRLPKRSNLPERIEDLLTPEQREELQRDLEKMARQRREAEIFARNFPMA